MDRRRFLLTPLVGAFATPLAVPTVLGVTAVSALPVFGWLVP